MPSPYTRTLNKRLVLWAQNDDRDICRSINKDIYGIIILDAGYVSRQLEKDMNIEEINNIEVVVHDLPPTSRIEGLLGLNALRALKAHINFAKETFEV